MGEILCSRRYEDEKKVLVEVLLDMEEYLQLQGQLDEVFVFSERVAKTPSRVSLRGKNEATKYFLIPRVLRKRLAIHGSVCCQRIDTNGKSIFVYVLDPCQEKKQLLAVT